METLCEELLQRTSVCLFPVHQRACRQTVAEVTGHPVLTTSGPDGVWDSGYSCRLEWAPCDRAACHLCCSLVVTGTCGYSSFHCLIQKGLIVFIALLLGFVLANSYTWKAAHSHSRRKEGARKGNRYSLQADCLQNTAPCIVHRTEFTCYTLPPVRAARGHFLYLILCSYCPLRLLSGLQPAIQQRLDEQDVWGKSLGISPPDSAGHLPEWFQEGTVMTVP